MATAYYPMGNTTWVTSGPTFTPTFPGPPEFTARIEETQQAARDLLGKITNKESESMPNTPARVGLTNDAPSTHAAARDDRLLLSTDAQQTIDGWVGQVLVTGLVVWQSEAFPLTAPKGAADDYHALTEALRAAHTKVVDTFRNLFGASPVPSVPTGFTAPQTPGQ